MRIDAHQHFWRYDPTAYPWIQPKVLKQDYVPEDLAPIIDAAGFDGTVAVQARSAWEENTWLLSLAERHAYIQGVVGWADVLAPDFPDRLATFAAYPKFCGVRCEIIASRDDPDMPHPDFVAGLAVLADADLAFDLLIRPPQLKLARNLVAMLPNQRFIVDHLAKPPIATQVLEPWATDIQELARLPNVACKVSGMVTEADPETWRTGDFVPYLDVVFAAFGFDRCMIGSDWPVCRQVAAYQYAIQIVLNYLAPFSAEERAAVLGTTAQRWYRL